MTAAQRETAYERIVAQADAYGVGIVDAPTIDAMNILRATHHAMRLALNALRPASGGEIMRPDVVLIDGLPVRPFPVEQIALVKGDGRSLSVAAASILAKVTRDRLMEAADRDYPQYGFAAHKGYPTPLHLERLAEYGACPLHRRSFAPVAQAVLALDSEPPTEAALLGQQGETVAAAHLRRLGWTILATRHCCAEGEIDLVAEDRNTLVFVEVKARRGHGEPPAAAVDRRKKARLVAAAEDYLTRTNAHERACRFDVLEVRFGADGYAKVNLLSDAFRPGE